MDRAERNELVEKNIGLVHACANKFRGKGAEYDDLFQAGCIGLIKAAENFDPERGFSFSTYAVPVILGEIKRIFRDGGSVKVSRGLKELGMKVAAVREKMLKQTGQEPTVTQIAARLQVTPEQVADAMSASLPALSLTPANSEDGNREFDILQESCEEALADRLSLKSTLHALAPQDRRLIYLRFFQNKTQSETARILGTTQVQISRRERKIIQAMRRQMLQ